MVDSNTAAKSFPFSPLNVKKNTTNKPQSPPPPFGNQALKCSFNTKTSSVSLLSS